MGKEDSWKKTIEETLKLENISINKKAFEKLEAYDDEKLWKLCYDKILKFVESEQKEEVVSIKDIKAILKQEKRKRDEDPICLEKVHKIYSNLLYIEDMKRIDVVLAVALSRKLEGVPLWLILVGPSGDMKSVQLNALDGYNTEYLHKITGRTLVNGYKDKNEHPDLAPKLDDKLVIIRDMASLLKLPPSEKAEVWGQLRDLYDGFAGTASGEGTNVKYKNLKVTLLAGSTPAIDAQILVHQDLGTRELIYRTKGNNNKKKVMDKCIENEEYEDKIKRELNEVTTKFLDSIEITRQDISQEALEKVKEIAIYTTFMRASAEFDNYKNTLRNDVYPEEPTRITKQLKRLYICLKNLDENYEDERAFEILWDVAKSSAFPLRVKLFEHLFNNSDREFSTSNLATSLKIGKSTVQREVQVMWNLGLVTLREEQTQRPGLTYDYWKINKEHSFIQKLQQDKENLKKEGKEVSTTKIEKISEET